MAQKVNKANNVRYIKLQRKTHARDYHHYKSLPWLNVSSVWLQEAGFNIGDRLAVSVEQGQLVIKNLSCDGDQGS